jgi:hypothetical protein
MSNAKLFQRRSHGHSHTAAIVITALSALAALLVFVNRQYIVDQISVWQYEPDASIVSLATRSGMSDNGKFYFYASQPAVEDADAFNKDCGRKEASTAVLGCYNGRNIFVYNVINAQLDGIKEVTAAHEMLHAAYDRLGDQEKKKIDALLEAEYEKIKNNKDIVERFAFYSRTEPGERDNELHSVIGTEIASISPELEAHYRKYFTNRSKVLALHEKYASVFAELQARGEKLSAQLTALGNTISSQTKDYNMAVSALNNDISAFNQKANSSGGFSSREEFESARASLVVRANELDATRDAINAEISTYNALREELKKVASQSEVLNQSIDSSLDPIPTVTRP